MSQMSDVDVALAAASAGAVVVRERYGGHLARLAKSGLDFATDVDVDAERAILATLAESRPDDRILGEESGATGGTGTRRPLLGPQLVGDPAFRAAFGPRVLSTTLALAWVAAGRHAGYVSDGAFVDNVHFAAGIALCRTAGCVVTDLAGAPLHTRHRDA